jgi:hypothetical protein
MYTLVACSMLLRSLINSHRTVREHIQVRCEYIRVRRWRPTLAVILYVAADKNPSPRITATLVDRWSVLLLGVHCCSTLFKHKKSLASIMVRAEAWGFMLARSWTCPRRAVRAYTSHVVSFRDAPYRARTENNWLDAATKKTVDLLFCPWLFSNYLSPSALTTFCSAWIFFSSFLPLAILLYIIPSNNCFPYISINYCLA